MYRILWAFAVVCIVTAIIVGNLMLPSLPEVMPSHWNSAGEVDGWQSVHAYIWFIPMLTLVILAILGIMSVRISDKRVRPYIAMSAVLLTMYMLGLHLLIGVRTLAGEQMQIAEFMRLLAGLFIGVAAIIKNVPPNHVVGFRLPWTMRDDDVWARTHTVGFWGMLIGGVSCLAITFVPIANEYLFGLGIGAILLGTIIPSVYSYWYWRTHRQM